MRYAKERCIQNERDTAYRIYVTDCLKGILENTARINGGTYRNDRYYDIYQPKKKTEVKSADEILEEVIKNTGLVVID